MNIALRHLGICVVLASLSNVSAFAQQGPESAVAPPQGDLLEIGLPTADDNAGGAPSTGEEMPTAEIPSEDYQLPPELKPKADAALAEFERLHGEFREQMTRMREIQIRYVNGDDQNKAAHRAYQEQRNKVRQTMDETYDAALELFRYLPHKDAGQYLLTMIQHRLKWGIYNRDTARGSAALIDVGLKYVLLFQAAARSGVVSGNFELANRVYTSIDDEKLETVDRVLMSHLDTLKANYEKEAEILAAEAKSDHLPRVKLETTRGEVVLELFLDQAPSTVSHFISLVENHFYDGLDFHQVMDDLLALTGDPSGVGSGNSGKALLDEHTRPDHRKAFRGSLVMAKVPMGSSGQFVPNSASSQFAILFLPQVQLTDQQTVFGRVVEGMQVISSLRRVDPNKKKKEGEIRLPPDRIISATVIRRPEQLPTPSYVQSLNAFAPASGP